MLSGRCLSCLSVRLSVCLCMALVYCGQTVGWINMKLSMMIGLGAGLIVLDGGSASLPKRGTAPAPNLETVAEIW